MMDCFKNLKKNIQKNKEDETYRENILKCNQIFKHLCECDGTNAQSNVNNDEHLRNLCIYLQELLYIDHFKYMYRNNKVI